MVSLMQIHPLCTDSQNGLLYGCLNVLDQPDRENVVPDHFEWMTLQTAVRINNRPEKGFPIHHSELHMIQNRPKPSTPLKL